LGDRTNQRKIRSSCRKTQGGISCVLSRSPSVTKRKNSKGGPGAEVGKEESSETQSPSKFLEGKNQKRGKGEIIKKHAEQQKAGGKTPSEVSHFGRVKRTKRTAKGEKRPKPAEHFKKCAGDWCGRQRAGKPVNGCSGPAITEEGRETSVRRSRLQTLRKGFPQSQIREATKRKKRSHASYDWKAKREPGALIA